MTILKNPWIIGVVNAFAPGLGYLLIGKRTIFASILLASMVVGYYWIFTSPDFEKVSADPLFAISAYLTALAFGVDAYFEAKS
jgi:hypothetical protein